MNDPLEEYQSVFRKTLNKTHLTHLMGLLAHYSKTNKARYYAAFPTPNPPLIFKSHWQKPTGPTTIPIIKPIITTGSIIVIQMH